MALAELDLEDRGGAASEQEEQAGSESDDDLPPIQRIQNRRVVEYEISESDSEDE